MASYSPLFDDPSSPFSQHGFIPELFFKLIAHIPLPDLIRFKESNQYWFNPLLETNLNNFAYIEKRLQEMTPLEILNQIVRKPELGLNKYITVALDSEENIRRFFYPGHDSQMGIKQFLPFEDISGALFCDAGEFHPEEHLRNRVPLIISTHDNLYMFEPFYRSLGVLGNKTWGRTCIDYRVSSTFDQLIQSTIPVPHTIIPKVFQVSIKEAFVNVKFTKRISLIPDDSFEGIRISFANSYTSPIRTGIVNEVSTTTPAQLVSFQGLTLGPEFIQLTISLGSPLDGGRVMPTWNRDTSPILYTIGDLKVRLPSLRRPFVINYIQEGEKRVVFCLGERVRKADNFNRPSEKRYVEGNLFLLFLEKETEYALRPKEHIEKSVEEEEEEEECGDDYRQTVEHISPANSEDMANLSDDLDLEELDENIITISEIEGSNPVLSPRNMISMYKRPTSETIPQSNYQNPPCAEILLPRSFLEILGALLVFTICLYLKSPKTSV